eukprot:363357-Chlamydomonas_euryale.AAC.17
MHGRRCSPTTALSPCPSSRFPCAAAEAGMASSTTATKQNPFADTRAGAHRQQPGARPVEPPAVRR